MRRLLRSWRWRVAVVGHSMAPTLREGDWLLVDPDAFTRTPPAAGMLIVVADPRDPSRFLIKRVAAVNPNGQLALAGDHPAHATKTELAAVSPALLIGRP